jgi:hypothetical protein
MLFSYNFRAVFTQNVALSTTQGKYSKLNDMCVLLICREPSKKCIFEANFK